MTDTVENNDEKKEKTTGKKFDLGNDGFDDTDTTLASFDVDLDEAESFAMAAPAGRSTSAPAKSPRKKREKAVVEVKPKRSVGRPRLAEEDEIIAKLIRLDKRTVQSIQKAADSLQNTTDGKGNFNRMVRLIFREYFTPRR